MRPTEIESMKRQVSQYPRKELEDRYFQQYFDARVFPFLLLFLLLAILFFAVVFIIESENRMDIQEVFPSVCNLIEERYMGFDYGIFKEERIICENTIITKFGVEE